MEASISVNSAQVQEILDLVAQKPDLQDAFDDVADLAWLTATWYLRQLAVRLTTILDQQPEIRNVVDTFARFLGPLLSAAQQSETLSLVPANWTAQLQTVLSAANILATTVTDTGSKHFELFDIYMHSATSAQGGVEWDGEKLWHEFQTALSTLMTRLTEDEQVRLTVFSGSVDFAKAVNNVLVTMLQPEQSQQRTQLAELLSAEFTQLLQRTDRLLDIVHGLEQQRAEVIGGE